MLVRTTSGGLINSERRKHRSSVHCATCTLNLTMPLAILTPIWHDRPETARRVRQRIGAVMKWAVAMVCHH